MTTLSTTSTVGVSFAMHQPACGGGSHDFLSKE